MFKVEKDGEGIAELKKKVMKDVENVQKHLSTEGVYLVAASLGSLEAVLEYLTQHNIKVFKVAIGAIHKKDVTKASTMLHHRKEYSTILAFGVKVTNDVIEWAEELGVKIISDEIIFHLHQKYLNHYNAINEQRKSEFGSKLVYPCVVKMVPGCLFKKSDPIIVGVKVLEGTLKRGTPLAVFKEKKFIGVLGQVLSIQINNSETKQATAGLSLFMC